MLQLSDINHKKLHGLTEYKDLRVERELKSGDEKLSFSYPLNDKFYNDIIEESYIRIKDNEYIVKEIHELDDWTEFVCVLNVEDLEGKAWDRFESVEQSIIDSLKLAIVGTGWTVGHCDVKKKRTVRKTNCSSWDLVQDIKKTYMVDMTFDCINKKINVYEHLGNDKGVYFIDSLNAKKIETQRDSYEFYTRIIPLGKDGLTISSINNGKDYVENHQYSKKIKTIYWKDDRYTVKENLKADAEAKLNELSKPRRAYKVDIVNLAKNSDNKYSILDYKLGDIITLISKDKGIREKQRIVKITEYLDDHSRDTVEIANTILSFEDMQQALQDTADTVDNITTDNGTVDGSTVDSIQVKQIEDFKANVIQVTNLKAVNADIEHLKVNKVDAQDLNAVKGRIGTLEATTINTTQFHALEGQIDFFKSNYSKIHDLEVTNEKVKILEGDTGNLKTLLNGNITSKNIQAGGILSDSLTIKNGFIKDAMIDSLSFKKINGDEINTNKFKIKSQDGGIEIAGSTQQFKDKNNKIRMQIGKDVKGNFNFILRGEDGTSTLIDNTGIKENAICNDLIKENMISGNAVGEKQINYSSFTAGLNKDSNTSLIKASKVNLDKENQTLDVAFSKLKVSHEDNKKAVESALTKIESQQGEIRAVIEESKITKDKQLSLENNYNRTTATLKSFENTLGEHKSLFDTNSKEIKAVEVKTNTIKKDLDSISQEIHKTKETIEKDKKSIDSKTSSLQQSLDTFKNELSATKKYSTDNIENLKNKTVSVESNLNKINTKIDNVDMTTKKINNKIVSQENKINTFEQKITPDSLTSTVLSSYQYKNNLNSKVSYENFTSYKQSSEEFSLKVKQGFGYNLIKNSGFENGLKFWSNNGGAELLVDQKWQVYRGEKTLLIKGKGKGSGIYQKFKCEKGKVYNVVFSAYPDGSNGIATSIGIEGLKTINIIALKYWCEHSFTFTATENEHTFIAYTEGIGNFYIDNIQVCEGSIIQPWSPHPSEIYGSTIKIDSEELRADYSDGSYSIMGRQGFEHWHNGMARPYHYLFHRGSVDKVNSQQTVRIYVPEEFRGKEYGMSWWAGNVFPQNDTDLIFSSNVELINQNKKEGWFDLKASLMVRNPQNESSPFWRGKMNIIYTLIA